MVSDIWKEKFKRPAIAFTDICGSRGSIPFDTFEDFYFLSTDNNFPKDFSAVFINFPNCLHIDKLVKRDKPQTTKTS